VNVQVSEAILYISGVVTEEEFLQVLFVVAMARKGITTAIILTTENLEDR